MTSRGKPRPRRRQGVVTAPEDSSDSDYSPGLSQILINRDGAFRGTCSRVAIPFDYGQPLPGSPLPESLKNIFQWSDDDQEASGYASSSTVSSVMTRSASVHMAENDDLRHRMDAQEQAIKIQQEALVNIQTLLG